MKKIAFFFEDPTNTDPHLYCIISDIDPDDMVLIVNITSIHENEKIDDSCLLFKGDHNLIVRDSYIIYKHAKAINSYKFYYQENLNKIKRKESISDSLLKRIQEGATKSKNLPSELKKYFDYF